VDYPFDVISGADYTRALANFGPVTDVLRRLIEAGIRSTADASTVAAALEHLNAAAALLENDQSAALLLRHDDSGKPVTWGNPVIGLRNAIAPPMEIVHDGDTCWSDFTLGPAYEGPPGWVHGGICALVLDHILGEVASSQLTQARFTGTISFKYLRGTHLGRVRAEAFVDRTEGVKTFARGYLRDDDGITVEAEGVFITPSWARGGE